jgi:hypothetical protein
MHVELVNCVEFFLGVTPFSILINSAAVICYNYVVFGRWMNVLIIDGMILEN